MRTRILIALAALPLALGACGPDEGELAYREGRYEDAHAAFSEVEFADPDSASAELLHNRALAALRAGAWSDAEGSLERASARAAPEVAARCDFLRGNLAFARCELAERQAATPEAEPFAFDVAIRFGEAARDAWQAAAASRPDWPEARRNVERALLKLADLRRQRTEKQRRRQPDPKPRPKLLPGPEPENPGSPSEEEVGPEAQRTELTPEQVLALLDRLGEKEREKLALRRSRRRVRSVEVEKDW